MEYRQLHDIKTKTSLLGFGCMRLPMKTVDGQEVIDEEQAYKMFDMAIESGVNYFDTAYGYVGGKSEPFVGKALKRYDRASFNLATKLPMGMIETYERGVEIFNDQMSRLQVEYLDFYLLHGINKAGYDKAVRLGLLDFLIEKQKAGVIRNLGFSFHGSYEDFEYILSQRKWDFCQLQLNYMDTDIQAGVKGTELAEKLGVPLIIMEPVKGGSLANFADDIQTIFKDYAPDKSVASWAIRWVAQQKSIQVVLSGMSTIGQMQDNINTFSDYKPLSAEELAIIDKVIASIKAHVKVGCTGCAYCMPCPFGVDIPRTFSIWNEYGKYNNANNARGNFNRMPVEARANMCQKCGACESKCPQELKIRDMLEAAYSELSAL